MDEVGGVNESSESEVSTTPWIDGLRRLRRNKIALFGLGVILFFILMAIFAPFLAPEDPLKQNLYNKSMPPSRGNLLGTDALGRDLMSRIIYGSRISLLIGIISVGLAMIIGVPLGVSSGYYGGMVDNIIMRIMEVILSFPSILLAIFIVATLGPGLRNTMIAVGLVAIPVYARITRASVLSVKEQDYVEAARALGGSDFRIMSRSIVPNSLSPLIVQSTLGMATAILDAAGLSFLGLGAQPPIAEWGAMLSDGRSLILSAPWVITFSGVAILLSVIGFNLLGDGLRDALDPRLKR